MNRVAYWFRREGDPPGQPQPLLTRICRMQVAGRWVTALHRAFAYDDVPQCRLCPTCTAVGGECMFLVSERIADSEAPLYQIGQAPGQG